MGLFTFNSVFAQTWEELNNTFKQLYAKSDYENALKYCDSSLKFAEKNHGKNHDNYAKSLNNMGVIYYALKQNETSLNYHLQALELRKQLHGDKSEQYLSSLNNLATVYSSMNNLEKVEEYLLLAETAGRDLPEGKNVQYGRTMNGLGGLYRKKRNFDFSWKYYSSALKIYENIRGKKSADYADVLINMALLKSDMNDLSAARNLYQEALSIKLEVVGNKHPDYAMVLWSLATVYKDLGDTKSAETYFLNAIEIYRANPSLRAELANPLNNLAILYMNQGRLNEALSSYQESAEIRLKYLGPQHADYGQSMNNIGLIYSKMGDFSKAEEYYLKGLQIRKQALGTEHKDYAASLSNLAVLYESLNNYQLAVQYHVQALEIRKKALGVNHPDFAASVNNIAGLYSKIGRVSEALEMYEYSTEIRKQSYGENSLEYAEALNNLGKVYGETGDPKNAEKAYLKSLEIVKKTLGENNNNYILTLFNLAVHYSQQKNVELAGKHFKNCIEIEKSICGNKHPLYLKTLVAYTAFLHSKYRTTEALALAFELQELLSENTIRNIAFLSEREMQEYSYTTFHHYDFLRSIYVDCLHERPELSVNLYNIEMTTKGMLLNSGMDMRKRILSDNDTSKMRLYEEWTSLQRQLSSMYSAGTAPSSEIQLVETKANQLEKQLYRLSSDLLFTQKTMTAAVSDIQSVLKDNGNSIEFSYFRYHNRSTWTDSTIYCAFIINKQSKYPVFVKLFEQKELEELFVSGGSAKSLYRGGGNVSVGSNKIGNAEKLYRILWQPLEKHIRIHDKVYFSVTGKLHQISMAAVKVNKDSFVSDRYRLVQLSSTGRLLQNDITAGVKPRSMFILGGVNYNQIENKKLKVTNEVWTYLPGTLAEVKGIAEIAKQSNVSYTLLSGDAASESKFYQTISGTSPNIVHISTHGYFQADKKSMPVELEYLTNIDNPLNRSGLLLSGGNAGWQNDTALDASNNGVLTAFEVASIKLQSGLVVLSACETGLGEITESEGVFGLQRAFRLAGAEYLLMSLWKIPDEESSLFMKLFYEEYLTNYQPVLAFNNTQNKMKKLYPGDADKWAAFVLIR